MRLPFPRFKSGPLDNSDSGNYHAALDRRSIAIEHLLYKGICEASWDVDRSDCRDESQTDVQMKLVAFTISLNEDIRVRDRCPLHTRRRIPKGAIGRWRNPALEGTT